MSLWRCVFVAWVGFFVLVGVGMAAEVPTKLEALRLEAFEPVAGEAVFRFPDGRIVAVDEGQALEATGAVLLEVLVDRVVIERDSSQPGIRETVWMFPAAERGRGGPGRKASRIQIVSLVPPDAPGVPRPVTEVVTPPASPPPL